MEKSVKKISASGIAISCLAFIGAVVSFYAIGFKYISAAEIDILALVGFWMLAIVFMAFTVQGFFTLTTTTQMLQAMFVSLLLLASVFAFTVSVFAFVKAGCHTWYFWPALTNLILSMIIFAIITFPRR